MNQLSQLWVYEETGLTFVQVATGGFPGDPAALVDLVLPATVDVPVDKAGILTADEQHLEIVAEVFQVHPGIQKHNTKNKASSIFIQI